MSELRTLGLLGGMSWESTVSYYQAINRGVKQRLGGLHSAKLCLYSVDFDEIQRYQHQGDWAKTAEILTQGALSVQAAGAQCLVICTNTMHKVAPEIEQSLRIPLLHIADATAEVLQADGIERVGLLGTAFTMQQAFYKERVQSRFGIEVLTPNASDQALIHRVIYQELCLGEINPTSRQQYLDIITRLQHQGAQAVILGCTEIALLVSQHDTSVPLYDTTALHAAKAVDWALGGVGSV